MTSAFATVLACILIGQALAQLSSGPCAQDGGDYYYTEVVRSGVRTVTTNRCPNHPSHNEPSQVVAGLFSHRIPAYPMFTGSKIDYVASSAFIDLSESPGIGVLFNGAAVSSPYCGATCGTVTGQDLCTGECGGYFRDYGSIDSFVYHYYMLGETGNGTSCNAPACPSPSQNSHPTSPLCFRGCCLLEVTCANLILSCADAPTVSDGSVFGYTAFVPSINGLGVAVGLTQNYEACACRDLHFQQCPNTAQGQYLISGGASTCPNTSICYTSTTTIATYKLTTSITLTTATCTWATSVAVFFLSMITRFFFLGNGPSALPSKGRPPGRVACLVLLFLFTTSTSTAVSTNTTNTTSTTSTNKSTNSTSTTLTTTANSSSKTSRNSTTSTSTNSSIYISTNTSATSSTNSSLAPTTNTSSTASTNITTSTATNTTTLTSNTTSLAVSALSSSSSNTTSTTSSNLTSTTTTNTSLTASTNITTSTATNTTTLTSSNTTSLAVSALSSSSSNTTSTTSSNLTSTTTTNTSLTASTNTSASTPVVTTNATWWYQTGTNTSSTTSTNGTTSTTTFYTTSSSTNSTATSSTNISSTTTTNSSSTISTNTSSTASTNTTSSTSTTSTNTTASTTCNTSSTSTTATTKTTTTNSTTTATTNTTETTTTTTETTTTHNLTTSTTSTTTTTQTTTTTTNWTTSTTSTTATTKTTTTHKLTTSTTLTTTKTTKTMTTSIALTTKTTTTKKLTTSTTLTTTSTRTTTTTTTKKLLPTLCNLASFASIVSSAQANTNCSTFGTVPLHTKWTFFCLFGASLTGAADYQCAYLAGSQVFFAAASAPSNAVIQILNVASPFGQAPVCTGFSDCPPPNVAGVPVYVNGQLHSTPSGIAPASTKRFMCNGLAYLSTCTPICSIGFTPGGSGTLVCQGQFQGVQLCVPIICNGLPPVVAPANVAPSCAGQPYGSICNISCPWGATGKYYNVGATYFTCEAQGQWTNASSWANSAQCIPSNCTSTPLVYKGSGSQCIGLAHNAVCSITCQTGYEWADSTPPSIKCDAGHWLMSSTCQLIGATGVTASVVAVGLFINVGSTCSTSSAGSSTCFGYTWAASNAALVTEAIATSVGLSPSSILIDLVQSQNSESFHIKLFIFPAVTGTGNSVVTQTMNALLGLPARRLLDFFGLRRLQSSSSWDSFSSTGAATSFMQQLRQIILQAGLTLPIGFDAALVIVSTPPVYLTNFRSPAATWVAGTFGSCKSGCGKSSKYRDVTCPTGSGTCTTSKPATSETCDSYKACSFIECPVKDLGDTIPCILQLVLIIAVPICLCSCIVGCCVRWLCCRPKRKQVVEVEDYGEVGYDVKVPPPKRSSSRDSVGVGDTGKYTEDGKVHVVWHTLDDRVEHYLEEVKKKLPGGSPPPELLDDPRAEEVPYSNNPGLQIVNNDLVPAGFQPKDEGRVHIINPKKEAVTEYDVILETNLPSVQRQRPISARRGIISLGEPLNYLNFDDNAIPDPAMPYGAMLMYNDGDQVEYYSQGCKMWLPGTVHPVVKQVNRTHMDTNTVIMYDIEIQGLTLQERQNVALYNLRRPFEAAECIEVYSMKDKGAWLPAMVNGPQTTFATVSGYQVILAMTGQVFELIPPLRLRRRFPAGMPISVYEGAAHGGWRDAEVDKAATEDGCNGKPVPGLSAAITVFWTMVPVKFLDVSGGYGEPQLKSVPSYFVRNRNPSTDTRTWTML